MAGQGLYLIRDARRLGGLDEALEHLRVDVGPAADNRAAAALDIAELGVADARVIGGVRDIEGHGNIGVDAERGRDGASSSDFLLHRACAGDIGRTTAAGRQLLEHARDDPHAALIVKGARNTHVLPEALKAHAERDNIAHLH